MISEFKDFESVVIRSSVESATGMLRSWRINRLPAIGSGEKNGFPSIHEFSFATTLIAAELHRVGAVLFFSWRVKVRLKASRRKSL